MNVAHRHLPTIGIALSSMPMQECNESMTAKHEHPLIAIDVNEKIETVGLT